MPIIPGVAPLTVYEVKDNTVYILVKLKASLEHIEEKYLLPFKVCIAEITGVEYEVAFVTENTAVIQEKRTLQLKIPVLMQFMKKQI